MVWLQSTTVYRYYFALPLGGTYYQSCTVPLMILQKFHKTLMNHHQLPGKKWKVRKLDDVDEAILKRLKDLEEKRTQP